MEMSVAEIAESRAELLHRLSNWGRYSTFDGSHDPRRFDGALGPEELQDVRLAGMTAAVAKARAAATGRGFGAALAEVELEVALHLARILAAASAEEEDEEKLVCGVCQEEMEMEMCEGVREVVECGHKFHRGCIGEWLRRKRTCPLCRCCLQ